VADLRPWASDLSPQSSKASAALALAEGFATLPDPEASREYIQSAAHSAYHFQRQTPGGISNGSESGSALF